MKESFSEFYVKLTDMVSRRNEAESTRVLCDEDGGLGKALRLQKFEKKYMMSN